MRRKWIPYVAFSGVMHNLYFRNFKRIELNLMIYRFGGTQIDLTSNTIGKYWAHHYIFDPLIPVTSNNPKIN